MRIAYIVLAHKLPEQLIRLVNKLNTDSSFFLIHVDKKTDASIYRRISESLGTYPNVRFLARHVCYWGDFGHLNASLTGIQEIIASRLQCDYVITLSGQDYPIKSNTQIRNVLQESRGQSFMEYFPLPDKHWRDENGGLDRIAYWHFFWRGHSYALRRKGKVLTALAALLGPSVTDALPIERRIPGNLQAFAGSALWCLRRDCVEFLYKFIQDNRAFLMFFKNVLCPDEIFYQTVLLNSSLRHSITNDDLRYIVWPTNSSHHPTILGKDDYEQFMSTGKLFARKFDITINAAVLDMIDRATS